MKKKFKKLDLSKLKIKKLANGKIDIKSLIISIILIGAIALVSLILVFALYIIITAPDFEKQKLYSKESTILYYDDGVTELARVGRSNTTVVTYEDLPQVLIDAVVATEDSRFFQHKGLDVARFMKATAGQLVGNSSAGGASTLTMQVVKRTYTNSKDKGIAGLVRKFTDIYMAVFKVESNYTKEEIFEFYINGQWFANDSNVNYASIDGIEQACQYYFGKSVKDLNLAEASLMAGMFQNPLYYNLYRHPDRARKRQETVLKLMVMHGYITESEKESTLAIPIASLLKKHEVDTSTNLANQAAIDYIVNDVKEKTGIDPKTAPLKIYTTIHKDTQDVLNKLEAGELYKFPNEKLQEGIAITSTENGALVAMSGGRGYVATGTNRAVEARQPGSTAKILFDYGPAIEYLNWSPATQLLDEQTTYSNGTPIKNANGDYLGLISMRTALVNSRNIPALRTFKAVNAEKKHYIEDFVSALGINYGGEIYESDSIGGHAMISPLQMSAAYAAFGRGGYYIAPYSYTKIENTQTGKVIEYKYEKVKVMSEQTAYLITNMLISASEAGVGGVKVSGTEIAAKSGTTNVDRKVAEQQGISTSATRDAWNVTYSPEYSIAQWIGYDTTTKEYYLTVNLGGTVRNKVMNAVGSRVYSKNKTFTIPSEIATVEVEKETIPVLLASEYTPEDLRISELFKEGTEPTETSSRFAKLANPTNGKYTFDGSVIKLTWNEVTTPQAMDATYLQNYFNTNFDTSATKYYEARMAYNNSYMGSLGYNIYRKDANGELTYIGRTESNTYVVNNPKGGNVTYLVKTAYSIFSSNMSDGLAISTKSNIDSNIDDLINDNTNNNIPDTNTDPGLE